MVDLTAKIERYGEGHMTHMDLYYAGVESSRDTLITDCVLLDISGSPEAVDLKALLGLKLVEKGNSVILKTGWEMYRDIAKYGESPWIDKGLIEALVARGACLLLVDSPGVYGGAAGVEHGEVDKYLADSGAHAVENLVNLDMLSAIKFKLYCFPIYMSALNAAPCRILAEC